MSDYETLRAMANDVANGDTAAAHDKFNSIISARVADSLETAKQEIAGSIYKASAEAEGETTEEE